MKSILESLIILKEVVVDGDHTPSGMCWTITCLGHNNRLTQEEIDELNKYLDNNAPDVYMKFIKEVNRLVNLGVNRCVAALRASKTTGHEHVGHWFKHGDVEPRLEWLSKHIELNKTKS